MIEQVRFKFSDVRKEHKVLGKHPLFDFFVCFTRNITHLGVTFLKNNHQVLSLVCVVVAQGWIVAQVFQALHFSWVGYGFANAFFLRLVEPRTLALTIMIEDTLRARDEIKLLQSNPRFKRWVFPRLFVKFHLPNAWVRDICSITIVCGDSRRDNEAVFLEIYFLIDLEITIQHLHLYLIIVVVVDHGELVDGQENDHYERADAHKSTH